MRTAHRIILFAALLFGASALRAQPYAVAPVLDSALADPSTGFPLSGGIVYVCLAGTACPGTPTPAYTDSSGLATLPNPIILSTTGFSQCGSPGSSCVPFFNTTLFYKLVIENSASVVLYTFDNLSAASGGGGGGVGTNFWAISGGSSIINTNSSGAGNVITSANLTVGGGLLVNGTGGLSLLAPGGGARASIVATTAMPANVTWFWPATDSTGVGCLSSNGMGQLSFIACGGGGGGGSPGGGLHSVQSQNPSGSFFGDGNFLYDSTTTPPQVSLAGIFQANGTTGGFNAPTCTAFDCIQAKQGGMAATQFTWQEEGAAPMGNVGFAATVYAPDPATMTYNVKLGIDTATFRPLAMSDYWASFTNGHCVSITVSASIPYFTDAGGACTTGGGGGTVSASAQFNLGYYTASGSATTIGGNTILNFTPASTPPQVSLAGVFQAGGSTGGVNVPTNTAYNGFQIPNGGMYAEQFTWNQQVFSGFPATSAGKTVILADNAVPSAGGSGLWVSRNAAPYYSIATTTGALIANDCVMVNSGGAPNTFVDSGAPCGGGSSQWTSAGPNVHNANAGSVGIGTASPGPILDVLSSTCTSLGATCWPAVIRNSANYGVYVGGESTGPSNTSSSVASIQAAVVGSTYAVDLALNPQGISNVLIGTRVDDSSGYRLQVVGGNGIESVVGFYSGSTNLSNAVNIPNGGIYGKELIMGDNLTWNVCVPTGSAPGQAGTNQFRLYCNSSTGQLYGSYNNGAFSPISGGSSGVPSITGTLNQISVNGSFTIAQATASTLALPQSIGTGSSVTFGTVTSAGTIQSSSAGGAIAFQTGSPFNFQVDGNGNVSAATQFNVTGVAGSYKMQGAVVVNAAGAWTGGAILPVTGNIQAPGGFTFAASGGFFGQDLTTGVTIGSCRLFFKSGILYSVVGTC